MLRLVPLIALFLLAACAGTTTLDDRVVPPDSRRQGELTRLYDNMGVESESIGTGAAKSAAAGDDRDQRFLSSLWSTRARSAIGARRLGHALAEAGKHELAFDWYERAYMHLDAEDALLPWLRYEMALACHNLGRNDDAINLLTTRMGTMPLPPDLKPKYAALLERASRG